MKKIYIFVFMLIGMVYINAEETPKNLIQTYPDGCYVNWTTGEIGATGAGMSKTKEWTSEGKVEAYRAAQLDALRKLVEVINKIHVDSNTTVQQYQDESGLIKKKIEGIVRNFTERGVKYSDDGVCNVNVAIPVNGDGSIADIFLGGTEPPDITAVQETAKPVQIATIEEPKKTAEEQKKPSSSDEQVNIPASIEPKTDESATMLAKNDTAPVTGLVVNASGKQVTPALNPQIISDTGTEVYGFKKANRDFRRLNGLASYAPDMDNACLDKRVTEKPFVMNAKSVSTSKPCIIIVSNADAEKFENLKNSGRVLEHCRVIIVTNSEK